MMDIGATVQTIAGEQRRLLDSVRKLVQGKRVRIIGNWNGQPIGCSKPSKKGCEYTVKNALFDFQGHVFFMLEGERCSISALDVEFIEALDN